VISAKGSCYYAAPVSVSAGFETVFTFGVEDKTCTGADGIAFIIHNDTRTTAFLGEGGGQIGYGGTIGSGNGAFNALVIELDSYLNGADLSGNEVSVHTNGTAELSSDEAYSIGSAIPVSKMWLNPPHTCRIVYTPGTLEVYIDGLLTVTTAYDFTTGGTFINGGGPVGGLTLINGTDAYVGFTSACGGCTETHDIYSWHWGIGSGGPGVGYCTGDIGDGTPCPCGNDNDGTVPGSGCANGVFTSGALLTGSGVASLSVDTLVLSASGLEPSNSGLYFQANNDLSPGNIWGDGLQCAGGGLKRLGVRFADASGNSDTSAWATPISVKAGNIIAGDTKYYQCWYRNPLNPPCGAGVNDFNASNGYAVSWGP